MERETNGQKGAERKEYTGNRSTEIPQEPINRKIDMKMDERNQKRETVTTNILKLHYKPGRYTVFKCTITAHQI